MIRTAASLLALAALLGGCASTEAEKSSTGVTSAESDLAACERVLRERVDAGTADMEGGTQPPECTGVTEAQIEDLFTEIMSDAFDTPPAVPEPEPTEDPAPDIAKVGADEWFEYEDGAEVQITKLSTYTMGEYSDAQGQPGVSVTVTVKNGSESVLDLTLADTVLTYGPNGESTEPDYGSDNQGFSGSIPPGRSATAVIDFGPVPKKHQDEILVEFAPTWDHSPAFFEGAAI